MGSPFLIPIIDGPHAGDFVESGEMPQQYIERAWAPACDLEIPKDWMAGVPKLKETELLALVYGLERIREKRSDGFRERWEYHLTARSKAFVAGTLFAAQNRGSELSAEEKELMNNIIEQINRGSA